MSQPQPAKRNTNTDNALKVAHKSRTQRYESLLFVHHRPWSKSNNRRSPQSNIGSHARRWQTDRRHQKRLAIAEQEATYARSLVGWRSHATTTDKPIPVQSGIENVESQIAGRTSWQIDSEALRRSMNAPGGLRIDSFNALPTAKNSKGVMQMVDYYIHVWSPYKSGAFDLAMGYNANVTVCWALALQDNMLFDATVAVARVAYCLSTGIAPVDDEFVLYHRGTALARLRERVATRMATDEEVIFTIARMLSIAYMCNDFNTWELHFRAYEEAAERYIASNPHSEITKIVKHRLASWKALHDFRRGFNPLREDAGVSSGQLSYILDGTDLAEHSNIASLPLGLKELALTGCVSTEVLEMANAMNGAITGGDDRLEMWVASGRPTRYCASLLTAIITNDILDKEFMLCVALISICLHLHHSFHPQRAERSTVSTDAAAWRRPSSSSTPLGKLAEGFLSKKIDLTISCQREVFIWASIVLGSLLLIHYRDLRVKGHIILVNLATKLKPFPPPFEAAQHANWVMVDPSLRNFLYNERLAMQWQRCWEESMKTMEEWETKGVLHIGNPSRTTGDRVNLVEYMVLRDARATLPVIRKVLTP